MPKTIVIASQKGGVGKTTTAVNLATALGIGGYQVLMIDLDPQGALRHSFGFSELRPQGVRELFGAKPGVLADLCTTDQEIGVDFILANFKGLEDEQETQAALQEPTVLRQWLQAEAQAYDFVIIDVSSEMSMLTINGVIAADYVLIPLQCEMLSVHTLKLFLQSFRYLQQRHQPQLRILGLVLTLYNRQLEVHRRISRQLFEHLHQSLFSTIIPYAPEIGEASALGKPVLVHDLHTVGSTAYIRLSRELLKRIQAPSPQHW